MKKVTEEWLKAARDDLDVIGRIVSAGHLSHMVAFHAQQCVEKAFKAVCEEHGIETRKTHNLVHLYGRIESILASEVDLRMLTTLDALYIEARYPGELGLLPHGSPTSADADAFRSFAENLLTIVSAQLR